jgi:hypothetical protein
MQPERPIAVLSRARAGGQAKRRVQGRGASARLGVYRRRCGGTSSVRETGSSLGCGVRRRAPPPCSLRCGRQSPEQTRPDVGAYKRPPGPVDAPGCSGLRLSHAGSSTRARSVWPCGLGRTKRGAASAQAHVRWASPMVFPIARSDALAVGLRDAVLPDLGEVGLARGMLPVTSPRSACTPQGRTASAEIGRGPPLGRGASGLGAQVTSVQGGELVRIHRVVCGRAAVDGFPREGRTQDPGHTLVGPQVGEPVPGEATLDGHHQGIPGGGHSREERFGGGLHGAGQHDCAIVAHDAEVHGAGMSINATGQWMLVDGMWGRAKYAA